MSGWGRHLGVQACAFVALGMMASSSARAGGFEVPDNGAQCVGRGTAFTAKADDLTALQHNPGALIQSKQSKGLYSHNVVHAPQTFTRQATQMPTGKLPAGVNPTATVENQTPWFALGGMAVGSHDFGLENWNFAVGVYGPSSSGHQEWPVSGGQRWMLTKLDALMVFYSAAAAYGVPGKYGIGVTGQVVHQPKTSLTLVVDGDNGTELAPYYKGAEVESTLNLSAPPTLSALVGGWWRPVEFLELGVSARPFPVHLNGTGTIELKDTPTGAQFTPNQLAVCTNPGATAANCVAGTAALQLTIPSNVHVGVRYRGVDHLTLAQATTPSDVERWDVELDFVWEGWSAMDSLHADLEGKIQLFAKADAQDVTIAKHWKDTLSLRLGGSYNLPNLPIGLMAGTFVETGAVPHNYENLDFASYDRLGVSGGVRGRAGPFDLTLAYSHIFQESRTVDEKYGKVFQQRPVAPCPEGCDPDGPGPGKGYDGVPANAGKFTSSFDIISASAALRF